MYFDDSHLRNVVNTTSGASFIFLAMGMLFFPEILYGLPNNSLVKSKTIKKISLKPVNNINPMVEEGEDSFLKLSQKIQNYFESEKPYINQNFSIAEIALKMDVPQNHVLYCINSVYKIKFSKLKTKLGIDQTKVYLHESIHSNITIDGIAQLAGFSSRSSFYSSFKEETGITPSVYLGNPFNSI